MLGLCLKALDGIFIQSSKLQHGGTVALCCVLPLMASNGSRSQVGLHNYSNF